MFERILVPLDGSELAEAVLVQVRRILFYKDAEILLVRAIPLTPSVESNEVELPHIMKAQAAKYLEDKAAAFAAQGARVRTVAREGNPAEVILDVATEEKASMIVMSTHGRSGIARWTLGSVAEKVLHASRVPVLAVRSFAGTGEGAPRTGSTELSLKKILVPIDTTGVSDEIVTPALELAQLFGSHILLLNVCSGPECMVPVPYMTRAYEQFRAGGVPVEPLMKMGDPAQQILETCREQDADLIAMTTHARGGVARWMMGSVTEKVLRASAVPLLVVRPARIQGDAKAGRRDVQPAKV